MANELLNGWAKWWRGRERGNAFKIQYPEREKRFLESLSSCDRDKKPEHTNLKGAFGSDTRMKSGKFRKEGRKFVNCEK